MTKGQIAALMLASAGAGVAIPTLGDLLGKAEAKPAAPYTHAVDLRRTLGSDAGVRVTAYATKERADGGTTDVGQTQNCTPSAGTQKLLVDAMNAAARECTWP